MGVGERLFIWFYIDEFTKTIVGEKLLLERRDFVLLFLLISFIRVVV